MSSCASQPSGAADAGAAVIRVLTLNLWGRGGDWPRRRAALRDGLREEAIVSERPMHAVLAGDLDAVPEAASIRVLCGLQSLDGLSVCHRDAWGATHPDDPGHTFALHNPLVMEESDARQEVSRRIDYIFVRCDEDGPTLEITSCALAFAEPIDGTFASDHFGADLEVAANN